MRHRRTRQPWRWPWLAHRHRDPRRDGVARGRSVGGGLRGAQQEHAQAKGGGGRSQGSGHEHASHDHTHDAGCDSSHLDSPTGNADDRQNRHCAQDPLQTPTPQSSSGANSEANNALFPPETKTTKTTKATTPSTKTTSGSTTSKEGSATEAAESESSAEAPSPILLDTDAASVYNPYAYPGTLFGDPSLAIDGEEKTAWTAQVQASVAPKMAEGLLLDLKSPQKLGTVAVKTTTTGITVEVYGAVGKTPPSSISDPSWKRVVGLKVLTKKTTRLKLRTEGKGYRYICLWLAKAPASSTAANPGTVAVNEFELFPPR